MVATYFDVEIRTVERYVNEYQLEFENNGYEILRGKRLKEFLRCINDQDFIGAFLQEENYRREFTDALIGSYPETRDKET